MSDAGGVLHPWWQLQDRSEHRLMPTAFVDHQLGYFFFFFETQHGDMSSDGNMLVHGVSVDATPRYVYLHGEWSMLLFEANRGQNVNMIALSTSQRRRLQQEQDDQRISVINEEAKHQIQSK